MTNFKRLVLSIFILFVGGCNSYKINSRGNLSDGIKYYFNSVDFFGKDCSEFAGIMREDNKIQEEIYYYSCSSLTPVKVLFNYNQSGNLVNKEYFISVIEGQAELALTENERQLLAIMSKKNLKRDYKQYQNIKGFRKTTLSDDIYEIPSVKKTK